MNDEFREKFVFLGERIGLTNVNIRQILCRGAIPEKHHARLLNEANETNTPLSYEELLKKR